MKAFSAWFALKPEETSSELIQTFIFFRFLRRFMDAFTRSWLSGTLLSGSTVGTKMGSTTSQRTSGTPCPSPKSRTSCTSGTLWAHRRPSCFCHCGPSSTSWCEPPSSWHPSAPSKTTAGWLGRPWPWAAYWKLTFGSMISMPRSCLDRRPSAKSSTIGADLLPMTRV